MKIAIGNDHRGLALKQKLLEKFKEHTFENVGTDSTESVDYPDFSGEVATKVATGDCERGILICSTGVGMSIAANKVSGVRAAMVWNPKIALLTRQHNDSNVLCLAGDYTDEKTAFEIVKIWIETPFEGGRHQRRVDKIERKS